MLNLASLNQRVNALSAKINNIVPGGLQDLATTLTNGDSANAPLKLVIADNNIETTLFGSTITVNDTATSNATTISETSSAITDGANTVQFNLNGLTTTQSVSVDCPNLGDINLNAPNMNAYGYALPISFTKLNSGQFSYTLSLQAFEDVVISPQILVDLPEEFFADSPLNNYTSTYWTVNFDMNCYNFAGTDKGFAIYLAFLDLNGNVYECDIYNQQTPFCKWDNPPGFAGTNTDFKSINFCDVIDFGGLQGSGNSKVVLQMYIAGDLSHLNVDYQFSLRFTRTQII